MRRNSYARRTMPAKAWSYRRSQGTADSYWVVVCHDAHDHGRKLWEAIRDPCDRQRLDSDGRHISIEWTNRDMEPGRRLHGNAQRLATNCVCDADGKPARCDGLTKFIAG